MKSADQARWPDGGSGVQAQDMRTLGPLRTHAPARDAVERLSDRALRAAVANPDHSQAAREAAAEALRARRITLAPWRASVRGFVRAQDLVDPRRTFFGWSWRRRVWAMSLTRLAALALIAVLASVGLDGPSIDPPVALALAGALAFGFAWWLVIVAFRQRPARVLYHGAGEESPLRAMIRDELRVFGNVVRMAAPDAPIVRAAGDYRALARRMRSRVRLNLATALSSREALPVAATPQWRGLTLQLIAGSSDAILVDLSDGAAPLDDLREEAQAGRCVFVTLWGRIEAAEASLAAAGIDAPCFFYAPDGEMQRRGRFRDAVIAAMRATHRVQI